jgi:hypothetical protein
VREDQEYRGRELAVITVEDTSHLSKGMRGISDREGKLLAKNACQEVSFARHSFHLLAPGDECRRGYLIGISC